jgi:hypothetical protein
MSAENLLFVSSEIISAKTQHCGTKNQHKEPLHHVQFTLDIVKGQSAGKKIHKKKAKRKVPASV